MERKYTVMHRWADGYTASRHGDSCKWSPVEENVSYTDACNAVLIRIAMEDGSPCETMRKAYRHSLAARLKGYAETRFTYDAEYYAVIASRRVRQWLRDENGEG